MSRDVPSQPQDADELRALLLAEREQRTALTHAVAQQQELLARYEATVEKQQRTIAQQEHTITQLLRRISGSRQERIDPDQLMLFTPEDLRAMADEQALPEDQEHEVNSGDGEEEVDTSSRRRKQGHGRRPLPASLPREEVRHELSPEERRCPCCGEIRGEIGRETSEQLEFVPASYKVLVHVRVKYACRQCQEHVAIAAKPQQPIDKGLPGPGLMAHTVLAKYGDHMPLYRQEDEAARHGLVLRRSTLCDWIAAAADLVEPLYLRMCQLVLLSRVVHTDDTSVKLLDPSLRQARTARFWAYIGDAEHPYSVYDFTTSRERDGPAKFLAGYRGYLQADAYGGYNGIYLESGGAIQEVACWTHCRRYWWEARTSDSRRAHQALAYIARLYKIEKQIADASDGERRAVRQQQARPILEQFGQWLQREQQEVLPKSPIAAAFTYTRNQWQALQRYTEAGFLSIDNNISERTVKTPAIGRKNWLFVASETGGHRAARLFSLTASCKANCVEPFAYLRDLFTRLPLLGDSPQPEQLDQLLPDRWLAAHPDHRWWIDDLRQAERRPP
jgi:transposase